jgi:hypothetical protein
MSKHLNDGKHDGYGLVQGWVDVQNIPEIPQDVPNPIYRVNALNLLVFVEPVKV